MFGNRNLQIVNQNCNVFIFVDGNTLLNALNLDDYFSNRMGPQASTGQFGQQQPQSAPEQAPSTSTGLFGQPGLMQSTGLFEPPPMNAAAFTPNFTQWREQAFSPLSPMLEPGAEFSQDSFSSETSWSYENSDYYHDGDSIPERAQLDQPATYSISELSDDEYDPEVSYPVQDPVSSWSTPEISDDDM